MTVASNLIPSKVWEFSTDLNQSVIVFLPNAVCEGFIEKVTIDSNGYSDIIFHPRKELTPRDLVKWRKKWTKYHLS